VKRENKPFDLRMSLCTTQPIYIHLKGLDGNRIEPTETVDWYPRPSQFRFSSLVHMDRRAGQPELLFFGELPQCTATEELKATVARKHTVHTRRHGHLWHWQLSIIPLLPGMQV